MSDAAQALGAATAYQDVLANLRNSRSLLEGDPQSLDPIAQQQLVAIFYGRPQATAGPAETVRTDAHVQLLSGRPGRIDSYLHPHELPTADNSRATAVARDERFIYNGADVVPSEDVHAAPALPIRDNAWVLESAAAPLAAHPHEPLAKHPVQFVPPEEFDERPYGRIRPSAEPSSIHIDDLTATTQRIAYDMVRNTFRQLAARSDDTRADYFARVDPNGTDKRSFEFDNHPVHETIRASLAMIEGLAAEMRDHHDFNARPNAEVFRPTWKTVVREVQTTRSARTFDQVQLAACSALFRFMNNFPSAPMPTRGTRYYRDFCDYYRAALLDLYSLRSETRLR